MGESHKDRFPWKEFLSKLYNKAFDADIFSHSAQVAFYFSFALFPLLYFLVSLFGIVLESSSGLKDELFTYMRQLMPLSVFDLVSKTVDEVVVNSSGRLAVISLAIALWSASAGVDAVRNALNAIYGIKETRMWLWNKAVSLIMTLVIAVLVAAVLAGVFYGWQLAQSGLAGIGVEVTSPLVLTSIQWLSTLIVMLFACEIIYNLLPDFKDRKWVWITAGSLVAIGLWLVLTSGFRLYLNYFNTYDRTYGSLGAVIIMMLWLYLTALVLMIGGVINSAISELNEETLITTMLADDNLEQ
jgi:membrane protein